MSKNDLRKTILEPVVFMVIFIGIFGLIGSRMGFVNMLNTLMNTAYDLLMNTVFYIMAIAVLAGAMGSVLSEFGVIGLVNKLVSPLITRPSWLWPKTELLSDISKDIRCRLSPT